MRGCITRMLNRELSQCWETWAAAAAAAERTRATMEHVLAALFNRHLKRGLCSWQDAYVEALRRRELMRHFVTLMLKRNLARGWRNWHSVWLEILEAREKMARALRRERERAEYRATMRALRAALLEDKKTGVMLIDAKTCSDVKALSARDANRTHWLNSPPAIVREVWEAGAVSSKQ
jgi:hypothetical protein